MMKLNALKKSVPLIVFLGASSFWTTAAAIEVSVDEAVDCHFAYTLARDLELVSQQQSQEMLSFWEGYFGSLRVPPTKGVLRTVLDDFVGSRHEFDLYLSAYIGGCDGKRLGILNYMGGNQ